MTENIEAEMKFLLSAEGADAAALAVAALPGVESRGRVYEKTMMFDDATGRMRAEDARLRLRLVGTLGPAGQAVEFSYKRRLGNDGGIKLEEEIETSFVTDVEVFIAILGKMGYRQVTSYERFRATFVGGGVKATLDEFPFGPMLELEGSRNDIRDFCSRLNLDEGDCSLESCDSVYHRLCREAGVVPKDHIRFDDSEMPHL
jgi:adenylate cyclase class IV